MARLHTRDATIGEPLLLKVRTEIEKEGERQMSNYDLAISVQSINNFFAYLVHRGGHHIHNTLWISC